MRADDYACVVGWPKTQSPSETDLKLVAIHSLKNLVPPFCCFGSSTFRFNFSYIYMELNRFSSGDRVIDVGSEWRTFSNEKALKDPSRVGDAQNPLLNGGDLTTMISKVSAHCARHVAVSLFVCIQFKMTAVQRRWYPQVKR